MTIPTYPLLLEENGYRIGHTYKVWSPGSPANAPHGGKRTSFNKSGTKFNNFSQQASPAADIDAAKEALFDEVRGNIRSFLDADDDAKVDGDKPFCYWFGPTNVHRKWIAGSGKKLWGIDPDTLKGKLPPFLPDVEVVREDFADYLGEAMAFDAGLGVIIEELKRVGQYENTILVVSGDHGIPGVTRGKCNLYDFGTKVPLAIRWPDGIQKTGRVVDDFVTLPDLAPTFLDIAGIDIPKTMTAKSLVPVLQSEATGQVDPDRNVVFTGRERHVAAARPGNKPYPQRAIRTDEYLYIINFEAERWPMGIGPGFGGPDGPMPSYELLRENTFSAFADMDASPTKAWVATRRDDDPKSFEYAFGRPPMYELYDMKKDEPCINNLAENESMATVRKDLHDRLIAELKETGDPRVSDNIVFENSPFTDGVEKKKRNRKPAAAR